MRIIDIHGAHVLDFERFHLEYEEFEESQALGYSVIECIKDIESFLQLDSDNLTTILPPPSPIFKQMKKGGKFDFDLFPFHYENIQLMQIMTFLSKKGLEKRVLPFLGFSVSGSEDYFDYLQRFVKRTACGLKFHPLAMETSIEALKDSRALEIATENKTPVLIHTGRDVYSDPRQLLPLANVYPQVNFCAAHFGYFNREFLERVSSTPNLFLDTCILSALLREIKEGNTKHICLDAIPERIRKLEPDDIFCWITERYDLENKILFGSDMKWTYHVKSTREKEIELAAKISYPSDKKDKWLYLNAKAFLKM